MSGEEEQRRDKTLSIRLDAEEVQVELLERLKRSRAGYKGHVTRMYHELETLMLDSSNYQAVIETADELDITFDRYLVSCDKYMVASRDSGDAAQITQDQYESEVKNKQEFNGRLAEWLKIAKAATKEVSHTFKSERDMKDSVSQAGSASSNGSRASRTSVKLAEARVKQAVAMMKVQQLKKQCVIKQEQRALEDQLVMTEAHDEAELAKCEADFWVTEEQKQNGNPKAGSFTETVVHNPIGSNLNPRAPVWNSGVNQDASVSANVNGLVETQKEAFQQMASAITSVFNMPRPELMTFDGNPTEYWKFVNNFDTNLGTVPDIRARLNFLIQHCKGEAREAIEDCALLEPDIGYPKARSILQTNYGKPHIIAHAYVNHLVNGPVLKASDSVGLTKLGLEMQKCEITLGQLGYQADMNNSENLMRIVRRLPMHVRGRWVETADKIIENGNEPNFSHLTNFIQDRARVANTMYGKDLNMHMNKPSDQVSKFKKQVKPVSRTFVTQGSAEMASNGGDKGATRGESNFKGKPKQEYVRGTGTKCFLCNKVHSLKECDIFVTKSVEERRAIMRRFRLCDNCFGQDHISRGCMIHSACTVPNCLRKHHTLLHFDRPNFESKSNERSADSENHGRDSGNAHSGPQTSAKVHCNVNGAGAKQVCLKVVPVKVMGQYRTVETYALLDSCSDVSLCTQHLVDELGIKGIEDNFSITTVNKEASSEHGLKVSLKVESLDGRNQVDVEKAWTIKEIPVSAGNIPRKMEVNQWSHLQGLNLPEIDQKSIGVLIGADNPEVFWTLEERRGRRKEPYAVRSLLGWALIGPTVSAEAESEFHVNFIQTEDELLHKQVEMMWKSDFCDAILNTELAMSQEDKSALNMMESSVTTTIDGHYQLGLPWRQKPPCLKNNHSMAEARLRFLKKRLLRDDDLYEKYKAAMSEYLDNGYASRISKETLQSAGLVWYIPHHPVSSPHKPGKVRVVFDCAAKFGGTSLNDQLLSGPDLTNNLVGVLTRFREAPIALMSDIKGMFNQVRAAPEDREFLRFLWWPDGDLSREPETYCMNVHLFGATSSPSCASFCLRRVAADHGHNFDPQVTQTIERNMYVDDCLKAVDGQKEAMELVQQLPVLLAHGGFRLTKWVCNDPEVLALVPEEDRASTVADLDLDHSPVERVLGIKWDVCTDQFWFESVKKDKPLTRRGILSVVSSLYDPLGLVAPLTLPAKLLLQDLCREKHGWDDQIGEHRITQWQDWLSELDRISELRVARCLVPVDMGKPVDIQLHHFSDASMTGYGSVAYLRIVGHDGRIHCSILLGKSRLAPLKVVTIPRLELSAAVVAVRLDKIIKCELDIPIGMTVFWTDSTSVLQYIQNESRRFQTFVGNRVAIIHENSSPHQWRHVDTTQNPADHASRGLHVQETQKLEQWIHGPEFLWKCEADWPERPNIPGLPDCDPEVKKSAQVHVVTEVTEARDHVMSLLIGHSSSWSQLQRWVAWLLRYKSYCRNRYGHTSEQAEQGELRLSELQASSVEILKHVQQDAFPEEFSSLLSVSQVTSQTVKASSPLRRLSPVMMNGILRVGGRLERAPIGFDAKHAVILPKNGPVTSMIVRHYHLLEGHSGPNHTLTSIRQKFWLIHGRATVKGVLSKCAHCRRRNAPQGEQFMAALPRDRLTPDEPPFTRVGLDYFGPLYVKKGRSTTKRYGCIFTCLASRAVHIEVAHSLDTDSFICALQRFMSRRGRPKLIRSDNGTNFKGGDRELREALIEWNNQKITEFLHQRDVEWVYNPPGASHMGGVWERLIRSVRQILRALLKEQLVSDETLMTTLTETERILNDRPLTAVSDDPYDLNALTPSQILLLKGNQSLPPGLFSKKDSYPVRRWRQAQYLANLFWRRWIREYLPTLQVRQKWFKTRRNFKTGDLVLIINDNLPRGQWPLGRIIETFPDKHGLVRAVKVRTATACLTRPVTCLCFLEASIDEAAHDTADDIVQDSETGSGEHSDSSASVDPVQQSVNSARVVSAHRARKKPNYLNDYVVDQ